MLGGEASAEIAGEMKNSRYCGRYMYDGYGHAVYDLAPDYPERMMRFLKKDKWAEEIRHSSSGTAMRWWNSG